MSDGPELIITEKNNAARRIAEILSDDSHESDRVNDTNVYSWGGTQCIGLSGHVVEVDFPDEYNDWRDVEPVELIDAPVITEPSQKGIVAAVRKLASEASQVIIATDYDREGELIGKEAHELVREVNETVPIDRVRFSSITDREVTEAFQNPDDLDFQLAAAGKARQTIDLMWGATLTRFLSLSAKQRGEDFISVGRVQSPTLRLLVEREQEIRAFDPESYWELTGVVSNSEADSFQMQFFYQNPDGTEAERVWDESVSMILLDALESTDEVVVNNVSRRTQTDEPPAPFDTTQFISAAGSLGYSAQRGMSLAEELYTAGYITYPRTDNTVYPDDLEPRELVESFQGTQFADAAETLLDRDELTPTKGDEETTDHPPIHPTGELPSRGDLSTDEWDVYELVVRRFFATVASPAEWERLRVVARAGEEASRIAANADPTAALQDGDEASDVGDSLEAPSLIANDGLRLKANGKRLVTPGYHAVYPYVSSSETIVPDVEPGDRLTIDETELDGKETQPPRRFGQSRLIKTMSDLGIGTKSTRHNTIEKLYDRDYVESNPPRPTRLAEAVVDAAEEFADRIVSEEMTAQLESDMTAIADGHKDYEEVTAESRTLLKKVFDSLTDSREDIADHLQQSLKADKTLGPCPECGSALLIRQAGNGSYFVGCDGYPDCEYTLPLPSTGKPLVLDQNCDSHELSHVRMLAGQKTFVHGCPQCKADEADEQEDQVIGVCPECGQQAGGDLAIKQLRSGSRLVGCSRYPDCEYSLPLPRRGEIELTDDRCEDHDLPELYIHAEDPWELGCPICNYREYQARENGSELQAINGIGEKTAEKLDTAGVTDISALKNVDPEDLAEKVDGVGSETVQQWQNEVA